MEGDHSQNLYTGTPVVPAPPDADSSSALAEVTIRTMASDIELLGQTGGSAPAGTNLTVIVAGRDASSLETESDLPPQPSAAGTRVVFRSFLGMLAIGLLFVLGYYGVPFFIGMSTVEPPLQATSTPPASLPDVGPKEFAHRAFFVGPSDAILTVVLDDPQIPAAIRPFSSQVLSLAKSASPQAKFFELENMFADSNAASWNAFASSTGLTILPADFVAARFEPDFTAFAWRDGTTFSPGYILKLRKGQTPLTLRTQVAAAIEGAPDLLAKFFLAPPTAGTSTAVFSDAQIVNQPVRTASFGSSPSAPRFLYGWFFNSYLIISTSEEGMREAVGRL